MVVEGWVGDGPWANPPKTRIRTHFWGLLLGCRCAATAPVMSSEKTQETKQTLLQQNHTLYIQLPGPSQHAPTSSHCPPVPRMDNGENGTCKDSLDRPASDWWSRSYWGCGFAMMYMSAELRERDKMQACSTHQHWVKAITLVILLDDKGLNVQHWSREWT